jgi:hypothetical protein
MARYTDYVTLFFADRSWRSKVWDEAAQQNVNVTVCASVLLVFSAHANSVGQAWLSAEYVSQSIGVSERQLRRALAVLRATGVLVDDGYRSRARCRRLMLGLPADSLTTATDGRGTTATDGRGTTATDGRGTTARPRPPMAVDTVHVGTTPARPRPPMADEVEVEEDRRPPYGGKTTVLRTRARGEPAAATNHAPAAQPPQGAAADATNGKQTQTPTPTPPAFTATKEQREYWQRVHDGHYRNNDPPNSKPSASPDLATVDLAGEQQRQLAALTQWMHNAHDRQ